MSTSEATGTRARSYATRPVHWLSDRTTGWIKSQYSVGDPRAIGGMLLATVIVYAILGGITFYAVAAVIPIGMNAVMWGAIVSGAGFGAWNAYRARRHVKQRHRARRLREEGTTTAGGEAMGLITSHDTEAQKFATVTVVETTREGGGGVMKQADASPGQSIGRLAGLLSASDRRVRLNAAAALGTLTLDYPEEIRQHREAIFDAVERPETEIQIFAVQTLDVLTNDLNIPSDELSEYLDALETAINDDDHRVRAEACIALESIDDNRATDLLESVQDDSRAEVREEANTSLKNRRERGTSRPSASSSNDDAAPGDDLIQAPPDMGFSDIAGMEELKDTLRDRVIDPFTGTDAYEALDVGSENGLLLHGPPGTGKTYVAKCLAGELGINYLPGGIGSIESKYIGEGVENIGEMFDQAHRNQPCLVFLDEFDALAGKRSDSTQQSDEQKQVNQLLQELSEVEADDDILVVAATNNPDQIDSAMLRTGRFDSKIEVPKPDGEARVAIFKHHLNAKIEDNPNVDVEGELVRQTTGCTASDMERIATNADRIAAKRQSNAPTDTEMGTDDGHTRESEGESESDSPNDTTITPDGGQGSVSGMGGQATPVVRWQEIEQAIEEVTRERGSVGRFSQRPPDMDFADVAGMEALKDELREKVIGPLESPEMFEEFGVSVENGFMLYGPPGTGKTHITKCLAGELDVTYLTANAGDLVSKWIGEGAENVQRMFEEARQNQPSLVFVDEIDALATSRGHHQTKSERQMVNQFLDEISRIHDEDADVIVIGATNRLGDVDDAIVRSGRLGEQIEVPPPDAEARRLIFEQHLDAPREDLDLDRIATLTEGFVASDMERLAETAAREALRRTRESGERTPVLQVDVEDAIEHIESRQ